MTNLLTKIKKESEKQELHSRADSVLVALSGGPDSVFLFYFYLFLKKEYEASGRPFSIYAAHLNHMLRGAEADRDESFCRELCGRYNVSFSCRRTDVRALSSEKKMTLEEAARKARYEFLQEASQSFGAELIATGHNADDQAETILFNLIRGSGIDGAAGIPVKRGNIIRPLLSVKKQEIKNALDSAGLDYVYDSSNSDIRFTRNKIRHEIIPLLKTLNPLADESLVRFGSSVREDAEYLDGIARKICGNYESVPRIPLDGLHALPNPLLLRVLRLLAEKRFEGLKLDYKKSRELAGLVRRGNGRLQLSGSRFAVCRYGFLEFASIKQSKDFCFKLNEGDNILPGTENFHLTTTDTHSNVYNSIINVNIPYDKIVNTVYVRNRREGDRFLVNGVNKSLKKLMIEKKIPSERRDSLLIVADDEKIFWCQDIGQSDYLR